MSGSLFPQIGAVCCRKCATIQQLMSTMIVCQECKNKRCPKASDHELACRNSNDPGQEGSVYK